MGAKHGKLLQWIDKTSILMKVIFGVNACLMIFAPPWQIEKENWHPDGLMTCNQKVYVHTINKGKNQNNCVENA